MMKGYGRLLILIIVLTFGGILACVPTGGGEAQPAVEILSPPSGSRVAAGEEVEVQFRATDEKAVVRVELEVAGDIVDTQTSPTAEGQPSLTGILRWTPTAAGSYNLVVYAYNSDGAGSTGVGVEIEVTEGTEPSPTVAISPVPSPLLFEDDFGNPSSGWEVGEFSDGSVGYRDGYYFVSATEANKRMWGIANQSFGDVVVEVEVTQFSAPANNNNAFGVSCRVQANDDGYHLLISGDGYYSIQRGESGSFTELVEWTSSDAINQGNAANDLRAVCDGSRLALYCNGQLLAETTDSAWAQGDLSLMAASLESEPTEVHFDNLKVYAPQGLAQPTPAQTPASQTRMLLEEDFSNPSSGWEVGEWDEGSVGYANGYYYVTSAQESMRMWGVANQSFSDVDVEVDATQFSGPASNDNAYGISCRSQSNGDAYNLMISGDGFYGIQKIVDGSFENIVDWTSSDVINQGNAANRLRAVCDGSRLALYCNGQLLAETTDSTFTSGDVALMVITYEEEATEVHFDNLKVYEPAP